MADRKGPAPPDYGVGYCRPPKASQFKPGKSGNPKGRPKGSRSFESSFKKVMKKKVAVTENGKTSWISSDEAILLRLRNDALRGDAKARRDLFELMKRHSDSTEASNAKNPGR